MYKIFHGFHLVEAYQDLKKARRLAKNQTVARCIKLTVAITISLILWLLPIDTFGIEGLTVSKVYSPCGSRELGGYGV